MTQKNVNVVREVTTAEVVRCQFDAPKRFKNSSNRYGYHPDDAIIFKIGQTEKLDSILK